jgi:transcriptional antiterminator NusG
MSLALQPEDSRQWYALQTQPKHEKLVSALLEGKGYEQFLPLYQNWHRSSGRLKSVMLPLFPGYVFCRFDQFRRLPILMTPGVFSIVSRGRVPEPIPDGEIADVQRSSASSLPLKPWPYLTQGDVVLVEIGPLRGLEGIFVNEKSSGRLVLSIHMLRRSVAVEMARDWIRPVAARVA